MEKQLGYIVDDSESVFYVTESTKVDSLPAGCYVIDIDSNGGVFLNALDLDDDNVITFPNSQLESILSEVKNFWAESKKYLKYKLPHKRGILIHGLPGVGKTTSIMEICRYMTSHNGVVVFCNYFDTVIREQLSKIREIEPDRPLVIVLEQLETILFSEENVNVELLEFIDGIHDINHILFIASTCDLNTIPDNVKKRPSRFDLKVEIKVPDDTDREYYFKKMIPATDIKQIDLPTWVTKTKGYTISHLKELITSYFIYGYKFESIITNINKLISNKNSEIGFNK